VPAILLGLLAAGGARAARADEPAVVPAPAPTPAPAPAGPAGPVEGPMRPEAQALYDRGLARFQAHDFAGATADFEAGYAIEPRPEFLFAEGQAKRLGGDCKAAVGLYQRFLDSGPPAVQVNATHIALGRCAQLLAEHPDVVVVTPPPKPLPPPPPPRWWLDPWAIGASAAGVVGLGLGVGFLIGSSAALTDANHATTIDDYNRAWATAGSRQEVAVVAFAAGAALTTAGVARFILVRRQSSRRAVLVPIAFGPAAFGVEGRF
jgi:hypothetical protein